ETDADTFMSVLLLDTMPGSLPGVLFVCRARARNRVSARPFPDDLDSHPAPDGECTCECAHTDCTCPKACVTKSYSTTVARRGVKISGSSSVIATVNSKCAESDPSAVTTVQSSSSTRVSSVPRLSIGSMQSVMPLRSRGPQFRSP